jgi:valyl-tRNA synthetase
MSHELPKTYDPSAIEVRWAEYWVAEKLFSVKTPAPGSAEAKKPIFTLLLPPPNVTGRLHMGHMLNQTEMDIIIRWKRMSGFLTLWLPGTDHAGIATQMMVERQLATEGKSRQKLGREAFLERVWEWKKLYGGAIQAQMKRLGASVDWDREYFTMDENLSRAVTEVFVRLHEQGLIYRGKYIVNWCPRCMTAISDLEVVHEDYAGKLYQIKYPLADDPTQFLTIATTRPETMLGDSAVAVNPKDERYTKLVGKKLRLPLTDREIPIIADDYADPQFGSGAVKVTPTHDPNDFQIGLRHNLAQINIMDDQARINENGGSYAGLDRYEAREKILRDLEEQMPSASVIAAKRLLSRGFPRSGLSRFSRWLTARLKPWKNSKSSSRQRITPRRISNGCATYMTGASRASCGGDIAFRRGTAPNAVRLQLRAPCPKNAPSAATANLNKTMTCWIHGFPPDCCRSRPLAGRKKRVILMSFIPPRC